MAQVLTESAAISRLFSKQKLELNFESNDDFLLFLLTNTHTVAQLCTLKEIGDKHCLIFYYLIS